MKLKHLPFLFIIFCTINSFGQNFITTKGKCIIKDGKEMILKGVTFENYTTEGIEIPNKHHNELDFERVKKLGMNNIRFCLHYKTFEDDTKPFSYKESGWDWLNKNISWAKKHNIFLTLNMQVPQGCNQESSIALWENKNNQERFIKLWTAIANKYKDEPQIAGFNLLNQPSTTRGIYQWQQLVDKTIEAIRKVDKNHMLIIERAKASNNNKEESNFIKVDDNNVMYSFHFYGPTEYTQQHSPGSNQGEGGKYPDPKRLEVPASTKLYGGNTNNTTIQTGTTQWSYYEGKKVLIGDPNIKVMKPVFVANNVGQEVFFGNFTIKEYTPAGKFSRDIMQVDPVLTKGWQMWSKNGKGRFEAIPQEGFENKNAFLIASTTDEANCYNNSLRFKPKLGYLYVISGFAKGINIKEEANCMFRFDYETTDSNDVITERTKAFLENEISSLKKFADQQNAPTYIGGFGLYNKCFKGGRGGTQWVIDMLAILEKHSISYSYYSWRGDAFGVYYGSGTLPEEKKRNKKLVKLLDMSDE